jgi:hypothetical protein
VHRSAVAYFYFAFDNPAKQNCDALLRCIISQVCFQSSNALRLLEDFRDAYKARERQPTLDEFKQLLKAMLQYLSITFLIIDAMDECVQRKELLNLLNDILLWNDTDVHVLVTGRVIKDIDDGLQGPEICRTDMSGSLVDADIKLYIAERLRTDPDLKRWKSDDRAEIERTLVGGAQGM